MPAQPATRSRDWRSSMRVEWHGQSAFSLEGDAERRSSSTRSTTCRRSPSAGCSSTTRRSRPTSVDLLLVTHEHVDHNGVEAIAGEPATLRSTAGTPRVAARRGDRRSPPSTTRRPGPSAGRTRSSSSSSTACGSPTSATSARRRCGPSRRAAIGEVDLLFLPVGGGPTIGGAAAAEIARDAGPVAGSCRCTTGRRGSTSSRPRRSSSRRSAGGGAARRPPLRDRPS